MWKMFRELKYLDETVCVALRELDPEQSLKRKAFIAASDGLALTLHCILLELRKFHSEEFSRDYVKECVNKVYEEDGEKCTLLIIASKRGHVEVVDLLLKLYEPDLETEGTIRFEGVFIEGASALWCAAGSGHVRIVKMLVEAGANVNHPTATESTPLRAACFDGRLDIVQFLVENSADIHRANNYNNTCLMIAAYKGHLNVVKYLLSVGVDPDEQALCGATALHFAAECGEEYITRALVEEGGAQIGVKNGIGMTPLMVAAERTRATVVEYLLTRREVSREEKIDAMELLGASFANDKDNYCPELAFLYLRRTMELRFLTSGEPPILKPQCHAIHAYDNHVECQNLEELDAIRFDHNALHMESLCIRERILGPKNPEVATHVVFRGAVFADRARFNRCIDLWMHALHLHQNSNQPIVKDLLRFAQIFSQMVFCKLPPSLLSVEEVLKVAIVELSNNREKLKYAGPKADPKQAMDDLENNLITVLYLLVIITKLLGEYNASSGIIIPVTSDEDAEFRVHRLVFQLNKLQMRMRDGKTLLHLALDPNVLVDDFHTSDICRFPSPEVAMLLIRCGADTNAMDQERNTPLHIVAREYPTLAVILALIDAGAHVDTVNSKGKTPLDIATTVEAINILRSHTGLSLKCMAAKAVDTKMLLNQNGLDVPRSLRTFIELHNVDARNEANLTCKETHVDNI